MDKVKVTSLLHCRYITMFDFVGFTELAFSKIRKALSFFCTMLFLTIDRDWNSDGVFISPRRLWVSFCLDQRIEEAGLILSICPWQHNGLMLSFSEINQWPVVSA